MASPNASDSNYPNWPDYSRVADSRCCFAIEIVAAVVDKHPDSGRIVDSCTVGYNRHLMTGLCWCLYWPLGLAI